MPSYNCCATLIVNFAVKPSFLIPSCCNVDVIKGAVGWRLLCVFLTFFTNNSPVDAFSRVDFIDNACSVFSMLNFLIFSLLNSVNLPRKSDPPNSKSDSIVQYSLAIKSSISFSRSTIILNAGD